MGGTTPGFFPEVLGFQTQGLMPHSKHFSQGAIFPGPALKLLRFSASASQPAIQKMTFSPQSPASRQPFGENVAFLHRCETLDSVLENERRKTQEET